MFLAALALHLAVRDLLGARNQSQRSPNGICFAASDATGIASIIVNFDGPGASDYASTSPLCIRWTKVAKIGARRVRASGWETEGFGRERVDWNTGLRAPRGSSQAPPLTTRRGEDVMAKHMILEEASASPTTIRRGSGYIGSSRSRTSGWPRVPRRLLDLAGYGSDEPGVQSEQLAEREQHP